MTDATHAPTPPAPGGVLDSRYRLDAVLGRGGYATVFRASDLSLGRDVAVKVFHAQAADTRDSGRIAAETRLLASVTHPSLVTLYDARLDAEPPFLVMELVDGSTLADRIGRGPLPADAVAALASELAEALLAIHDRGIVHRDLKPSNVLLRPATVSGGHDRATLADFGIATLVDSARVTATGTLVGTAAYLSPEQARGQCAGTPTDVYALGLVLLEALTGRRAFGQSTPQEALAARLVGSPDIPASVAPEWRTLLSAMTAADPAHRPDAHAVLRAIERLPSPDSGDAPTAVLPPEASTDAPTRVMSPRPPETADGGHRRPRRAPWIVGAVVIVALLIAVPIIATALSGSSADQPADQTLPTLPAPLDSQFQQLLDEVQP
ncbi:protein kinase [Microbacterium sp. NPDC091313]